MRRLRVFSVVVVATAVGLHHELRSRLVLPSSKISVAALLPISDELEAEKRSRFILVSTYCRQTSSLFALSSVCYRGTDLNRAADLGRIPGLSMTPSKTSTTVCHYLTAL